MNDEIKETLTFAAATFVVAGALGSPFVIHAYVKAKKAEKKYITFLKCSNKSRKRYEDVITNPGSTMHECMMAVREERQFLNTVISH